MSHAFVFGPLTFLSKESSARADDRLNGDNCWDFTSEWGPVFVDNLP